MKKKNFILDFILRYFLMIAIAIPGLYLFYLVFTPLTFYSVYWFFDLFTNVSLSGNSIYFNSTHFIEIIGACVAGSAYYLLFILNLSTPNIKFSKRIYMLLISFGLFLAINLLRIIVLGFMYIVNSSWFETAHELFWYLGSVVFVVGIWFLMVWKFGIKEIPFYSDIKHLTKQIKKK
jgi:exosortase/archaeosortase family protein